MRILYLFNNILQLGWRGSTTIIVDLLPIGLNIFLVLEFWREIGICHCPKLWCSLVSEL